MNARQIQTLSVSQLCTRFQSRASSAPADLQPLSQFADLLKKASSNTAQQQAEHAKQERDRLAAKKAAEETEQRRQAELRRLAEDRRKEREDRERKEQEAAARKQKALPKTTNLWALRQERKRLGLDPDGKDDHLIGSAAAPEAKPKSYKELLSKANSTAKSSASAKGKAKEKEPAVLSRAEKAQRKQAALFNDDEPSSGAFALAQSSRKPASSSSRDSPAASAVPAALKRTGSADSAHSSRNGSPASASNGSKASVAGSSKLASRSNGSGSKGAAAPAPSASGSARSRLAAQVTSLQQPQKLNVVKRDTRTIEEIERDMKMRKANANGGGAPSSAKTTDSSARRPLAGPSAALNGSTRTKSDSGRSGRGESGSTSARRPRSPSPSSDSDDYSSDDDRPRKRSKGKGGNSSGLRGDQRNAIWKLMGRNREQDLAREQAWSGSDDSDMEATGEDVLQEERLAARAAAREEAAELARERKRVEEKAKRKLGQGGK
ncbi:hypothetical protein BMF94_4257 [Rhodotorula taiwanensis]|uniref:Uncharacterized protein n=1 Tax=Rhodotorula taiwanensis TaxID=741276 RepID=A0A2S5B6S0_9BASI|nr:hypothetical protein BMF94_4257 [Rhodotorula taiwanensis]